MAHRSHTIASPLAPFVDSIWMYKGTPLAHAIERRLPDGMISMIINLRDDEIRLHPPHDLAQVQRFSGALLVGAHSSFTLLDTATAASVVGVQFKPGGASAFLPWPAHEIQESEVALDLVWGTEALDLRGLLSRETSCAERFALVERFLLARFDLNRTPHAAVAFALTQLHRAQLPSIAEVSDQLALSRTRLNQLFRGAVGLTPKQYQRVQRFQGILHLLEQSGEHQRSVRWSELAIRCGFYDQAHLTREFHLCAGLTPGAYLRQRGEHRNHVPVSA